MYVGKWSNGYMHGPGRYTSLNGTVYDGDWRRSHSLLRVLCLACVHLMCRCVFFRRNLREGKGVEQAHTGERYDVSSALFSWL